MRGDPRDRSAELIVYIDRSDIRAGRLDELKAGLVRLVQVIESLEPQLISYGFHLEEEARWMTVIAVHPDSASLERHLDVGGPEFRKLAQLITLREIDVFGSVTDAALQMLQQKAKALGGADVTIHNRFAGFSHPQPSPRT